MVRHRTLSQWLVAALAAFCWALGSVARAGLAEALDDPMLVWATGVSSQWAEVGAADAASGSTVVEWRLASVFDWFDGLELIGWLETTVQGPAVFSVKVRHNDMHVGLEMQLDGRPVELLRTLPVIIPNGQEWNPWTVVSCRVPAGVHRVRLSPALGTGGSWFPPKPGCQIDQVTVRGADNAVATALETSEIAWFTTGDPVPRIAVGAVESHDGEDAVILEDQFAETWLQGTLAGPATLDWWEKGSGQFSLNGSGIAGGGDAWVRRRIFVPAGEAVVRWGFDQLIQPRPSSIALDEVKVEPSIPVAPISAVSTAETPTGLVFSGGWAGATTSSAPDGQDLAWVTVAPSTAETLRVPVTGAGIVLLTLASRNRAQVSFAVDGREAAGDSQSVSSEFDERRFFVPPGAQWFEMRVQPSRFTPDVPGTALIDGVRFVPASTVSLATALDEPALTFTTHPDRPWAPLAWANAIDGTDSCASADSSNGNTWLETEVSGAGTLRFEWTSTEVNPFRFSLHVLVDDRPMPLRMNTYIYDGNQMKGRAEVEMGPGPHRIRWLVPAGHPFGYFTLDRVAWAPHGVNPGAGVLDAVPAWMASGFPWVPDDSVFQGNSGTSLRFGPVARLPWATSESDKAAPGLRILAEGPAIARFLARTESGSLRVTAHGQALQSFTTAPGVWVEVEMFVPPGASFLDLVPVGGGLVWSEETTVWIDRFALIDIRRPLAEVLPGQGFQWSTNPENPWVGGSEEALAGLASSASPSWLETTVAGPALVDWRISGWVDFSVDGKKAVLPSYTDFSNQRSGGVFLEPGLHTLRWTNPGDSVVRLRDVTLSPMSGVPEVSRRGDKVSLRCPRPVGVMDIQLKPQLAFGDGAYYTQLDGAYTIAESTPERIVFEMPVPPGVRAMLFRLMFQR